MRQYRFRSDRFLILAIFFGLLFYQNCGRIGFYADRGSLVGDASFSSEACESFLMSIYSTTFFPLLKTNCNACHSNTHGSTDLQTSFQGFMAKTPATIEYKATHPHSDNGINLTPEIAGIKSTWDVGFSQYKACDSNVTQGTSGGVKVRTNSKIVANLDETAVPGGQNNWKTVEWDLMDETASGQGRFDASLKIEVRMSLFDGKVVGFDFRNPMMKLNSGSETVYVKGLRIFVNESLLSNVTTYSNVDIGVSGTNYMALSPGSGIALAYLTSATPTSMIALELQDVGDKGPETEGGPGGIDTGSGPITWTELTGSDPSKNVFANRCVSCHQGASPAGGLNLTNYNQARISAADILERATDSNRPMPPSGLLSTPEIGIINRWSTNGAPQ